MAETYGNMGNILRLDMTTLSYELEDSTPYLKKYLGGRSLNHYLLFKDVNVAKVQAFDPENEVIFSVGPLGGTLFPSSGRYQVTFIAPLPTSGFGDANSGGAVGPIVVMMQWLLRGGLLNQLMYMLKTIKFSLYLQMISGAKGVMILLIYLKPDMVKMPKFY
jgi:hypothetical protein